MEAVHRCTIAEPGGNINLLRYCTFFHQDTKQGFEWGNPVSPNLSPPPAASLAKCPCPTQCRRVSVFIYFAFVERRGWYRLTPPTSVGLWVASTTASSHPSLASPPPLSASRTQRRRGPSGGHPQRLAPPRPGATAPRDQRQRSRPPVSGTGIEEEWQGTNLGWATLCVWGGNHPPFRRCCLVL